MAIEQRYVESHPGSEALYRRASKVLPSGVTHDSRFLQPFPTYVAKAEGARKWDVDGHEYVDYVMGHGALLLGHNHPVVAEAAAAQLALGTHYGASHEREVEWAEEVIRLVPSADVVRFTSSGTEATLMCLRLARAFTGRPAAIKFDRHFHGWHDYVVGATRYGAAAPAGVPGSTLESVIVLPPDMAAVRQAAEGRDDIGAVIVEAAGASSGALPLPAGFLKELEALARERGIVFVMDEVVTGFRWSPGGVQQLEGVRPDLTALAKILAGGFPGGAVAGRREIMQHLAFAGPGEKHAKVGHPGTFNANPLSAAAGVACLREVGDGEHQAIAAATASKLRTGMNAELARLGVPAVVYGQSSMVRIVLGGDAPPALGDPDPRALPKDLLAAGTPRETQRLLNLAMLNEGVHVFGDTMIVSAVHGEEEVARTLEAWGSALAGLRGEGAL